MADIGSVWASGSWSTAAWAAGTWANASTVVVTGGSVYLVTNGAVTPPANSTTIAQQHWMWVQGMVYRPTAGGTSRPAIPRDRT